MNELDQENPASDLGSLAEAIVSLMADDLTNDPPVKTVDELAEMDNDVFVAYVSTCTATPTSHPVWQTLTDRAISKNTQESIGVLFSALNRLAAGRKEVMPASQYAVWRVQHVVPRLNRLQELRGFVRSAWEQVSVRRGKPAERRPCPFEPGEVLGVQEVFDLVDDDLTFYVDLHLDDDVAGPVWESLLHRVNVRRTKMVLGRMIQAAMRWREKQKARVVAGEWNERGFVVWRDRTYKPRMELLQAHFALVKVRMHDLHQEHQELNRRTSEKIALGEGTEVNRFDRRSNNYFLKKLVMAIYWHRRDMLAAGLAPTQHDLKLWRQVERMVEFGGQSTTLDELYGTGRYGLPPGGWPEDFQAMKDLDDTGADDEEGDDAEELAGQMDEA